LTVLVILFMSLVCSKPRETKKTEPTTLTNQSEECIDLASPCSSCFDIDADWV
jgi:hypothetical protein